MTIYRNQTSSQAFKIAQEAYESGQLFDFADGAERKTVDVIVYDDTKTYSK